MEFDSWSTFEEYLKAATPNELHQLALEHLHCWNSSAGRCDFDMESIEDSGLDETVILRVIGTENVATKTLITALDNGSPDGDWATAMSYAVMSSPAISKEVLLLTQAWNQEQAWWIINHELADREIIENLEAKYYSVGEIIERMLWLQQVKELTWSLTESSKASGADATEVELQAIVELKISK